MRHHRQQQRKSQTQIATLICVSPQQYQKYESGLSKCPIDVLLKLSQFYGACVEDFLPSLGPTLKKQARSLAQSSQADLDPDELARLITAFSRILEKEKRLKLVELIEMQ